MKLKIKKPLRVPEFKNEAKEREFWSKVDLSRYFEKGDFESVSFPNLKPSSQSIAIRIPSYMLWRLKERANELDVPYQSLIKEYISRELVKK